MDVTYRLSSKTLLPILIQWSLEAITATTTSDLRFDLSPQKDMAYCLRTNVTLGSH